MKPLHSLLHLIILCLFLLTGCATHQEDLSIVHQDAYKAYKAEDYVTAVKKFEILVEEIPKDGELWFRLGNSYARAMMPQQAITAYQNSLLRNPRNLKAWYNMGLVQMKMALKSFADMQSYVDVDKNDPVGLRGKAMMDGLFNLLDPDEGLEKQK